jgi:hypothetical protein
MGESTIDTVRQLLNGSLERTDDPEVGFKLRTALQLLSVVEERDQRLREDLEGAALSDEVVQRLDELGYLD